MLILFSLLMGSLFGQLVEYPVPSSNFTANFCNFPLAWEACRGKSVPITVVSKSLNRQDSMLLCQLVPKGCFQTMKLSQFIGDAKSAKPGVALLLEEPTPTSYKGLLRCISQQISMGSVVVVPALFKEMNSAHGSKAWRLFLERASALGAVIVGAHGPSMVIGDLDFIRQFPIDLFAYVDIEDEGYPNANVRLKGRLESCALPVAAGLALYKGSHPMLSSKQLKSELRRYSKKAIWGDVKLTNGNDVLHFSIIKPTDSSFNVEVAKHSNVNAKLNSKFYGRYFDAGLFVAHHSYKPNEWSYGVLQLDSLRLIGTGKGIKVAILDHLFSCADTAITKHYVNPGSVFPSVRYDQGNEGHGTWMARKLLDVAPEVSIIPIRITDTNYMASCVGYVKGIDYALNQGANIISLSHQPVDPSEQAMLDSAIDRASLMNVFFVYIHYSGSRNDVVKTTPIEFVTEKTSTSSINVIGTGFNDENEFPFTWGFSQTAPIVAGVIALIKERSPSLSNEQILHILRQSYKIGTDGVRYLDAKNAIRRVSQEAGYGVKIGERSSLKPLFSN